MHPAAKMGYLFLQSLVPTVPASFLVMADGPIYRAYERFPKYWGLTATTDQQVAGAVMKLGGAAILWAVIVAVFFRWFAREAILDQEQQEPLPAGSALTSAPEPAAVTSAPARSGRSI